MIKILLKYFNLFDLIIYLYRLELINKLKRNRYRWKIIGKSSWYLYIRTNKNEIQNTIWFLNTNRSENQQLPRNKSTEWVAKINSNKALTIVKLRYKYRRYFLIIVKLNKELERRLFWTINGRQIRILKIINAECNIQEIGFKKYCQI